MKKYVLILNKLLIIINFIIFIKFIFKFYIKLDNYYNNSNFKLNYNGNFAIIQRKYFSTSGLMSYYFIYIGCAIDYIYNGFIPIINLSSHPNIFNGFNTTSLKNPWEIFFNQPFGYKLENIMKYAKNIKYVQCHLPIHIPNFNVINNIILMNYWHNIANIYMPIKKYLYDEANYKFKILFKKSNNVLGILIRGTDYIAMKPKYHPIQPSPDMVFKDIIKMDNKNKYDWFFITTEDDLIRDKFIKKFGKKLKFIKSLNNINYDYNKKIRLCFNQNIKGNIDFYKIYVINIIILSKCLDIITSRTSGTINAFILSKGFRNKIDYNLGTY